jgi:hypothetical protein
MPSRTGRGKRTSEAFTSKVESIDLKPYLDEIQAEVAKGMSGGAKTDAQWNANMASVESVISNQCRRLAKELGLAGDPMLLYMLTKGILSTAWVAFAIRRASIDEASPFEQRLTMMELANALPNALSQALNHAVTYAEVYVQKPPKQ